jgi:UDP-glucose 4-epimerase
MRLLVTGGAGYIGSVIAAHLLAAGHDVVVLDDLSTGDEDSVPPGAIFIRGSIREQAAPVLAERGIDAVLHFAASSLVGESVANPAGYWANNLGGTIDVCREVTGCEIPITVGPRRPGDPAILVASAQRIQAEVGWQARGDLRAMVTDAWQAIQAQCTQLQERAG